MQHKTIVTLSASWRIQGLFDNALTIRTNEMLKQVQHDVQIDSMTQYGQSYFNLYQAKFKPVKTVLFHL